MTLSSSGPGQTSGEDVIDSSAPDDSSISSSHDPLVIPQVPREQVDMHLLEELFVRIRESVPIGIPAILLVAYTHSNAVSRERVWGWLVIMLVLVGFRLGIAHQFLSRPVTERTGYRTWLLLAIASVFFFTVGWVSCMGLFAGPDMDGLFYLRMLVLSAVAAALLNTQGVDIRVYGVFLVVFGVGVIGSLYAFYPLHMKQQPELAIATLLYLFVLFKRSISEENHTREWIESRLAQGLLVSRLYKAIEDEQAATRRLMAKSAELEAINQQLHDLAIHDGLTKTYNRSHMQRVLRQSIYAYSRYQQEFSVLMMDVDFFKSINDNYGHAAGDEVLCRLVTVAEECLREADLFGRWGGEEFLVLLPNTNLQQAASAGERLRKAVANLTFSHSSVEFCVTVSIGASMAQLQKMETPETLIDRADSALYAAKNSGRDCVVAAPVI
jgi:diguanylate cyclase (GGDEF)-like protein